MLNRFLSAALTVLGLLAGAPPYARAESPDPAPLRVGLASVDVTPEIGVPLGGFGGGARRIVPWDVFNKHKWAHYLKPSQGVADPIRAKAMVLERGEDRLLFMSLDTVGVTAAFYRDLQKRIAPLGIAPDRIFVSGTHTHSGPGAISSERVWELLAMDRFQPAVYARFVDGIVRAVERALEVAAPAELYSVEFAAEGIQKNRRGNAGHFDAQARMLTAMTHDGRWLGGMVNLPVHGTALGTGNHLFSADLLGGVERALETRFEALNGSLRGLSYAADRSGPEQPVVLFMNGAEGDVAPVRTGFAAIAALSEAFAEQTLAALPSARRVEPSWNVRRTSVKLGKAGFNLIACVKDSMRKWVHRALTVRLGNGLPREADLWAIDLGDLRLMTWPGEPTTSLGLELKRMALESGARDAWVLGLTNGHLAYFVTPEEHRQGGYESCSSLYGAQGGRKVLAAYRELFDAR